MRIGIRHSWLGVLAVGLAVLLSIGVAVGHSLRAQSASGHPVTYVVINPISGRVTASGPRTLFGATVELDPKTGDILKVSGPSVWPGARVTLNPKNGQIVKLSR